jgi:hypothetical protein
MNQVLVQYILLTITIKKITVNEMVLNQKHEKFCLKRLFLLIVWNIIT